MSEIMEELEAARAQKAAAEEALARQVQPALGLAPASALSPGVQVEMSKSLGERKMDVSEVTPPAWRA